MGLNKLGMNETGFTAILDVDMMISCDQERGARRVMVASVGQEVTRKRGEYRESISFISHVLSLT